MAEVSSRLLRRIQLDFPHDTQIVIDKLGTLDDLVVQSGQDPERILAAVVHQAAGRLDRLDHVLAAARLDWRDLLVAADLADQTVTDRTVRSRVGHRPGGRRRWRP